MLPYSKTYVVRSIFEKFDGSRDMIVQMIRKAGTGFTGSSSVNRNNITF